MDGYKKNEINIFHFCTNKKEVSNNKEIQKNFDHRKWQQIT